MSNLIQLENAKTGTTAWQLSSPVSYPNPEIEGYASATSVNRGGSIDLLVNVKDTGTYRIDTYRIGWYGGDGGRLVDSRTGITGVQQTMPSFDSFGMKSCSWTSPQTLTIPSDASDWTSGVYLAKLTKTSGTGNGKQSHIIFTVRDDDRHSDFLFQSAVTTWQAYNDWGGRSFYTATQARKVSFNRPYGASLAVQAGRTAWAIGTGSGEFITNSYALGRYHNCGSEINMVRWMEKQGYDVSYSTDIDTHLAPSQLLIHKAFIIVFHDEYCSTAMRNGLEAAIAAGVHLACFAANTYYWHVRFEDSERTLVCYKQFVNDDPDPLHGTQEETDLWAGLPTPRSEAAMLGVSWGGFVATDEPLVITNPSHWFFAGTGFTQDQVITAGLNGEIDVRKPETPADTVTLCHSPYQTFGFSDMTIRTVSPHNTLVYAAGMFGIPYFLDDYNGPSTTNLRPSYLNAGFETAITTLFERFLEAPATNISGKIVLSGKVVIS